jgi:hypothetical protein
MSLCRHMSQSTTMCGVEYSYGSKYYIFKVNEAKSFKTQTKTQIEKAKELTKVCL